MIEYKRRRDNVEAIRALSRKATKKVGNTKSYRKYYYLVSTAGSSVKGRDEAADLRIVT